MAERADAFRKAIVEILDGQSGIKPRERDRQLRAAAARYAPESFVTWASKERAALEHKWETQERAARVRPTRDVKRAQEYDLETKAAMRRAIGLEEPDAPEKSRGRRH